jgi:hypothetical protein
VGRLVNVITDQGERVAVPEEVLGDLPDGYRLESAEEGLTRAARAGRVVGAGVNTPLGIAKGVLSEGLGGLTLGLTQVAEASDPARAEEMRLFREERPGLATGANIAGAVLPALATGGAGAVGAVARATPAGRLARFGESLAKVAPEASTAAKVGRGALGGFVEGGGQAFGGAAADLAITDKPLDVERFAGELSSRFLYGGVVGGVASGTLRGLDVAASAAKRRIASSQDEAAKLSTIPDDIAAMDGRTLHAAEKLEKETIEAALVPQRQQIADEILDYRTASKAEVPWAAVATGRKITQRARQRLIDAGKEPPPLGPRWVREAEKEWVEAHKTIDRKLRDPRELTDKTSFGTAARAQLASALRIEEKVVDNLLKRGGELEALYLADRSTRRADAFKQLPDVLERNRAIQAKLGDLAKPATSERLEAIQEAKAALTGSKMSLGQKVAAGATFAAVTGAASGLNVPGMGYIAPVLGAAAGKAVADGLAKSLAKITRSAAERTTRAADTFAAVGRKAERVAPVLASKVLDEVRFGPEQAPRGATATTRKGSALERAFDARAEEIAAQVQPGPDGKLVVRQGARKSFAGRLQGIAAPAPRLADRLETHAVARLEFLANKMPRSTRLGMTRLRPSEMEIRAWARYIAAADDPAAIEERLADGTVTPEDAEVMRAIYPERMATITTHIIERLATLRETLPFQRQIALAIFTGAPVAAACEPEILAVIQEAHVAEEGAEGGTQAPMPQAAFASVQKSTPTPTPAQARSSSSGVNTL